ncbi:MAG: insulinase family protein [Oscillospiraceae bacterium]|nr:insulinase family protein [Oscillospiraceae bacterium]
MKRFVCLLLTLAMLFTAAACGTSGSADPSKLPKVGDKVEGFVVRELRDFPLIGAQLVLFEHERTGAELMYIANNDTNRVFDLTFFTRAIDNTGLPHVFEHSTLDGSEKYPSKALFFNLSYQTYNTYMNAMTSALYTTYPVGSLSEAQLLRYADYYTDSCLHPAILTDESIYREEAWRYRLADANDELSIEGTVYSEMKGARDLTSSAYTNILRAAFPGSTIGNVSGGEPESIPDMTWEGLRAYHEKYYHPSNCIAYLYGRFEDYTAFLKLLDEAFAPYEKREFSFEDPDYTPLAESVTVETAFPVEAGSGTENSSDIFYAFLCPGLKENREEENILNTLTDLLVADASPLMQSLKRALPSGSFASYIEIDGPEDMIVFYGTNVNPEDAETFRGIVDSTLADIAANGFPADLVDSVMASLSMSTKLSSEGDEIGVDLISSFAGYHAATGAKFGYADYVDALEKIAEWNEQGLYADAVTRYLGADALTALSVTYPEPGLREKLDTAEAQRLAELKAAMSAEEIAALVEQTNAEDEEDDASEYVKALQAVTVSSLPEEIRSYEVSDETGEDGVRYINVTADVDGVGMPILFLDGSGLSQQDIHWFDLYCYVVGQMDTSAHTREELAMLTTRYLYNAETRLSLLDRYGTDEFRPCLRVGWTAADEDLEAGYDLMREILFDTDFSDTETLSGLISQAKASLKSSINGAPYSTMLYRAMGAGKPLYRYYSYFNGFEYYSFLEETEQQMENYPAIAVKRLERIRDYFHNRTNAAAVYAGSAAGAEANAPLVRSFMASLDASPIEPVTYEFEPVAKSEALIVDSSVQYNGLVASYDALGIDGYSGEFDAAASLISDAYLYPQLRDQYGAYGVFNGFMTDGGYYVVSYRDPNVTETFDVFDALPDFLRSEETDQEELDGYILSAYAYYAKPDGELSGAVSAALSTLTGEPLDIKLQYMRDLKTLTPEKIKDYAPAFDALVSGGLRFTAGGAGAINANAGLYDVIYNPFGSADKTQIVFEDLPEDSEYYEAVRLMFEEGLMLPAGETVFDVEGDALVGDMAYALYALGFGEAPPSVDAARAALGEYGIMVSNAANDAALSGNGAEDALASFSPAVGLPYQRSGSATDEALSRGEFAEVFVQYLLDEGIIEDDGE